MRRLAVVSAILLALGAVALLPGRRREDPIGRTVRALDDSAEPTAPGTASEPVWVAIDFVDLEAGGSSEYFGRADRRDLDALLAGRLSGYLCLDEVFWMFEDGEVERLDDDIAYGASAHFRVDGIRRITPLKAGFADAARHLPPGDRIVPGPGRDA